MSFVNFNNREELSSRKYTKTVVLAALLEAETKNIVKAKNMIANLAEEVELNEALSLFSDKIGAMRTLDYVANLYQPILEGQFSWLTHDTAEQIGSERENTIQVWMFDNQGNMWFEKNYAGYGEFGGMDYYEVVAKMNGYSDEDLDIKIGKRNKLYRELREIGIALAFGELETRDKKGDVLFPALMADPKGFNYKRWDFSEEAPHDPNQSWYVEPEYDEEEWEEEYESKNEAMDFNDPVLVAFRAAKAEREVRLAAAASAPKKAKLYGKKRSEAEDKLWTISQDLKDLYSDRNQLLNDMEAEAGELGMEEFEKSGKHDQYGGQLNTIEDQIQDLLAKRGQLEMRLAESLQLKDEVNEAANSEIEKKVQKFVIKNANDYEYSNQDSAFQIYLALKKLYPGLIKESVEVNEAWVGPFKFTDKMSDDELKKMYDEAVSGYANWQKGFEHPKSDYKKAYQEIAKILKKRGVVVESVEVNEARAVKRFDKKLIDDKFQVHQEGALRTIYSGVSGNVDMEVSEKWIEMKGLRDLPEDYRGQHLGAFYELKTNLYLWVTDMKDAKTGRPARDSRGDAFFNVMAIFTMDGDEILTLWERPSNFPVATHGGSGVGFQYESVKVNEAEVDIIPEVEGEFMQLYSKLNDLAEETTDTKWRKAIEGIIKGLEGVESKIGQTANKLGVVPTHESTVNENYEVIFSDGVSQMKKFRTEKQALDFMHSTIASNKKLRDIAVYKPGMHSTTQTELVVAFWGNGSYLDNVSKKDDALAAKKIEEGNAFGAARAEAIAKGKKTFKVGDEEYDVEGVDKEDKENAKEFVGESVMAEIDILAKNAKNFKEFVKAFKTDDRYKGLDSAGDIEEFESWLKSIYDVANESADVNEGRSINKIQKEWSEVTSMMKSTVEEWKKAEGDTKGSLLDKLKSLTARKNELEKELDGAVQIKDVDAELAESKKPSWDALIEEFKMTNEDLRSDLKKYIKANEKELNELADNDNWDAIYDMLRNDFSVKEGSKEDEDLISTFNFIF